ncbi:hypothetical protein TSUD_121990 [Trifolium subterraneum]|nr:hypothetical protein TSUD_121990 [Trifolium subterraneum]
MLSSFLGIDERDAMTMFATLNGPYLKHTYVANLVTDYLDAAEAARLDNAPMHEVRMYRERCVRAFLLFLVGCTIFSNKTSYYLHVVYIQYFQDLSSVHEWNWGAAALVHLQHYLDDASQAGTSQMAGYMTLLELETNFTDDMPLNAKFAPGQGHKDSRGYRQSLDNIQVSDIVFSAYDDRRHVRPLIDVCWFSGWLRCGNLKAKHLPERVLRQFKYVQGIARDPDMSATPNMNIFEIDRVFAEEVDLRMIDENMRGQPVKLQRNNQDHLKLEVLIEESQERRDPNPLGVCRSVRDEVQRALDAGEAEEGTPVHGTLRRILNMLNPCLTYKRLSRGEKVDDVDRLCYYFSIFD